MILKLVISLILRERTPTGRRTGGELTRRPPR